MITIYTILVISSIFMQAFFTASEMAFTSVNKIKLKELIDKKDKKALRLNAFIKKEGGYLGSTLVGTNIAVIVSSVLATRIFVEYFGHNAASVLTTVVMVPVTLIFAEIVPKMIARQFSTGFALFAVGPLGSFYRVFYPLIKSVTFIASTIIYPFTRKSSFSEPALTKSDLKRIVLLGHETGEMKADEVELIHKVLDFEAKKVERIMVPLYRVSSVSIDDSDDTLKQLVSMTGFSRIPVYEGNKNNIIGIINIYDILFCPNYAPEENNIRKFLRDPVFINREDGLDIALARLRHQDTIMGIVRDDNETVAGIITIEDIMEEIIGEIEDTDEVKKDKI